MMTTFPSPVAGMLTAVLLGSAGCGYHDRQNQPADDPPLPPSASGAPDAAPSTLSAATLRPLHIEITGRDYQWLVHYPGADGKLGTPDDRYTRRHVNLPANVPARIDLKSDDYLYTLALPRWDKKEIAVPDMTFSIHLQADETGTYELRGDQMCGYAHPQLLGRLVVQSPEEFIAWMNRQDRVQ